MRIGLYAYKIHIAAWICQYCQIDNFPVVNIQL
jgi:hypothetical protein